MGEIHEEIIIKVITSFSVEKRGRLFKMMQGTFRYLDSDGVITISPYPKSKDKKKQNGFPDIFGFELMSYFYYDNWQYKEIRVPVYCLIEVKTKAYPTLTQEQKNHLDYCVSIGGKAYVARESDSQAGYTLEPWQICN